MVLVNVAEPSEEVKITFNVTSASLTVIAFVPFITCLFWLVLNPMLNKNGKDFRTLELLLALLATVSVSEAAILFCEGDAMIPFFLAKQFFAPLIIPVMILYVSKLTPGMVVNPTIQAWIAVPISLLFAESILIMLSGTDIIMDGIKNITSQDGTEKAAMIIRFCSVTIFYSVLAIQIVIWAISIVRRISKGSLNRHFNSCTALILVLTALEITVTLNGMKPSWILAVLFVMLAASIFIISYAGLFKAKTEVKITETKKEVEPAEMPREPVHLIADASQSQMEEEDLRIRFEDLIVTEQLFLKQGIRISDIASMLETNRTYVSRLVNNTYNMSFSDYINTLRIDYAEQYLIHHREAKQSDIAAACGFPNASAFNNVFKKITGVTPKIWLATRSGITE